MRLQPFMLKNKIKIPKRIKNSHKGDYGRVLIVAGSSGMLGAAILSSRGALRSGAGLVYLAVPNFLRNFINLATPEVIVKNFYEINDFDFDVLAIGPGLSINKESKFLVDKIVSKTKKPLVVDADALNILSYNLDVLIKSKANIVLTPHPGEMARLTGLDVSSIQKNRVKTAAQFAKKWGVCLVLKGDKTVIADKNGDVFINSTGNPGMASAGMGDVLTGVIASFIGQGFSPFLAAQAGVAIHGLAGDIAKKEKGELGLIASDIVDNLPKAIVKAQNG